MHIIKLDAIDSTNLHLKRLIAKNPLQDYTVIVTEKQLNGRGQIHTNWISEYGKNLTFSILKTFNEFEVSKQVMLNCSVSLAILDALQQLSVPDMTIKWPNDIMSGNQKICGILIENIFYGNKIKHAVIGIGLNVNQTNFENLKNVSSLQLLMKKQFELHQLMIVIVEKIKCYLDSLQTLHWETLKKQYEKVLFRKDKPSTFEDANGKRFMGFIRAITKDGMLRVALEDNVLRDFALKEIRLLY